MQQHMAHTVGARISFVKGFGCTSTSDLFCLGACAYVRIGSGHVFIFIHMWWPLADNSAVAPQLELSSWGVYQAVVLAAWLGHWACRR